MFAVGVHGAGPSAPGSNPVETSVIFPGSDAIGLASPAKELGVARATVQYLDAWTQQNAFPQVFGAAGRVFHGQPNNVWFFCIEKERFDVSTFRRFGILMYRITDFCAQRIAFLL